MALADIVIVMNNGEIEQAGPAVEIFNAPKTEFVARFMGGHNVIKDGLNDLAIRADKIKITSTKADDATSVEAVIQDIEYLGTSFSVTARREDGTALNVTVPDAAFSSHAIEIGQTVFLNWTPGDTHHLSNP